MWWALAVVAVAVTASDGTSMAMGDMSLSCSKIGEGGSFYQCDDRAIDVLGVWPLVWVVLLLAAPLVVAALAMREWVSWVAVAALVGLSLAWLQLWAAPSFWYLLIYAVPLAALGAVAATFQPITPRPGTSGRRSTSVA